MKTREWEKSEVRLCEWEDFSSSCEKKNEKNAIEKKMFFLFSRVGEERRGFGVMIVTFGWFWGVFGG